MRLILPDHGLRQNPPVARYQRGAGIVAGGFEAEDQRHSRAPLPEGGAMH
jgi:hypothetical protein